MMNYEKKIVRWLYTLALALSSFGAVAADIRPHISKSGSYRAIVIEGEIKSGDFEIFIQIVKENQGKVSGVYIFSPGGDFYEAMKIGRAMRALELSSHVPMRNPSGHPSCRDDRFGVTPSPKNPKNCTCASAGFFIHIGGIHRGGTYLAVHRPFFEKGKFGSLSQAEAKKEFEKLQQSSRAYMKEMGVPRHIQEDVLGTPSDKILVLDEKTVKTHFWLELPYRHEWIKNRCSILSGKEKQQLEIYSNRLRVNRLRAASSLSDLGFSSEEWADMEALRAKEDKERDCAIKTNAQSRITAYEKYFRTKPADFKNHNYSKWSNATKYLGKKYYELLSEEKFDEDNGPLGNHLERSFTARSPYILLSDSSSKPKVVVKVTLLSMPNPSTEFISHVVSSLQHAWGSHSGGNGATEWFWDTKNYSAKLTQPVSKRGPYLSLVIEER